MRNSLKGKAKSVLAALLSICMVMALMPAASPVAFAENGAYGEEYDKVLSFIPADTTKWHYITSATIAENGWVLDTAKTSSGILGRIEVNAYDLHRLDGAGLASLMSVGDKIVIAFDVEKNGVYNIDAIIANGSICAAKMSIAIDGATVSTVSNTQSDFGFVEKDFGSIALNAGRHYMAITHPEVIGSNNRIYLQQIALNFEKEIDDVITFGAAGESTQLITEATLEANGWALDAAKSEEDIPARGGNAGYGAYYYASPEGFMCANLLQGEYMALNFNVAEDGKYDLGINFNDGVSEAASNVSVYMDDMTNDALLSGENLKDGGAATKSLGEVNLTAGNHTLIVLNSGADEFGSAFVYLSKLALTRVGDMGAIEDKDEIEVVFGGAEGGQLIAAATLEANGWALDAANSQVDAAWRCGVAGYDSFYYAHADGYLYANLMKDEYLAFTFNVAEDGKYDLSAVLKDGLATYASGISIYVDSLDSAALLADESLRDGNGAWSAKALGEVELTAGNHALIIKNNNEDEFGSAFVYLSKLVLTRVGDIGGEEITDFTINLFDSWDAAAGGNQKVVGGLDTYGWEINKDMTVANYYADYSYDKIANDGNQMRMCSVWLDARMGSRTTPNDLTFNINAPKAGTYTFSVETIHISSGPELIVFVNEEYAGAYNTRSGNIPSGGYVAITTTLKDVYLKEGVNTITFSRVGGNSQLLLKKFIFKGVAEDTGYALDKVVLAPEKLTMNIGETMTVKGGVLMTNGTYKYMNGAAFTGVNSAYAWESAVQKNICNLSTSDATIATVAAVGAVNTGELTYTLTALKAGSVNLILTTKVDGEDKTVTKCIEVIDPANEYMPGDINGDGKLNARDVIALRRHVVGGYENNVVVEELCDFNGDGRLNGRDVIALRQYIVG